LQELEALDWDSFRELELEVLADLFDGPVGLGRVVVYAGGAPALEFSLFSHIV